MPLDGSEIQIRQTPEQLHRRYIRRVALRLAVPVLMLLAVIAAVAISGRRDFTLDNLIFIARFVVGPLFIVLLVGVLIWRAYRRRAGREEYAIVPVSAPVMATSPQTQQQSFDGELDANTHASDTWEVEAGAGSKITVSAGIVPKGALPYAGGNLVDLYIEHPDRTAAHFAGSRGAYLAVNCEQSGLYRIILVARAAGHLHYTLYITVDHVSTAVSVAG